MENKTIVEYVVLLLNYFENNSIFELSNYRELIGITDKDPDQEKTMVLLALQELEKNDIVRSLVNKKNQIWALFKPLSSVNQNLDIGYSLAAKIAETINHYCYEFKTTTDFCDPKNIKEKDILNLLVVINYLRTKNNVSPQTS
jgi:hypothetical protein